MTILVTGGTGYIGSHTCVELLTAGYNMVVVDNLYNPSEKILERVKKITGRRVKSCEADLPDQPAFREVFDGEKIDSVAHFAGLKAAGESVYKPLEYYHNNITGTLILCGEIRNHGVKNIVFSSSATVYGNPTETPITESCSEEEITSPHGQTKGMPEQILMGLHTAGPEWNMILLRYSNPIGARESGLIGKDPKGTPNNLVLYTAQVVVEKLDHLSVFDNDYNMPDGTGVRDYIHVVDLVEDYVKAVQKLRNKEGVSIYNLEAGVDYSMLDVPHVYEKAYGRMLKYEIQLRREGDVATCYSDSAKTKRELGWVIEKGVEEMCADSWKWQSMNPSGYRD